MRCEEFESRLDNLLDERRSPETDPQLAVHAAGCARCQQLSRDYEGLLEGVAALGAVAAPSGLAARVLADWQTIPVQPAPRRRPRQFAALALAATLLLAAVPSWLLLRSSNSVSQPGTEPALASVANSPAGVDSSAASLAATPRPALLDQVRETYEPLLVATEESLAVALSALPATSQQANPADVPAGSRARPASEGDFVASIEPVTQSATRSVAALFRVLPGSDRGAGGRGVSQ